MKKIPLYSLVPTITGYARVSDEDYTRLKKYRWWAMFSGQSRYACRREGKNSVFMHQIVCPSAGRPKFDTHHKDNDGWNNLRGNLKSLTRSEHSQEPRRKRLGKATSKYVGVHWHAQHKKWCAELKSEGRKKHLGLFDSELAACRAYRKAKRALRASSLGRTH